MLKFGRVFLILLFFLISCGSKSQPWAVYYGSAAHPEWQKKLNYLIADPDHVHPSFLSSPEVKVIAYFSVGEIESYRTYFGHFKSPDFLVEANENWEGNYRIDLRNPQWQNFILNEFIPSIMKRGFKGIFLDTIDTAIYLENKDSQRFAGSTESLKNFIKEMRRKYPHLIIVTNNTLEIISDIGNEIDAVCVEDLFTRYDFKTKTYKPTPLADRKYKEEKLLAFQKKFSKPILNLLYDSNFASQLIQEGIDYSNKHHFNWYITDVSLQKFGKTQ